MFHVGQKVECIRKVNPSDVRYGECVPLKGAIYTVRDVIADDSDGSLGLRLEEIVNPPHRYRGGTSECSFGQEGFRPIVDDKKKVSFTTGADPDSERWDNRKKQPATRERVGTV